MMTNADITVLNKFYDSENRQEIFLPTVIKGVSLYMKHGSSGDNKFRASSAEYKIRVPKNADMGTSEYVDAVTYRRMSKEVAAVHWTLQADAVIILAAIEESEQQGEIDLTELTKKYGSFVTVTDFSDNTIRGIESMKHWRIGGV